MKKNFVILLLACAAALAAYEGRAAAESAGPTAGTLQLAFLPDLTTSAFRPATSAVDSLTTSQVLGTPRFQTAPFGIVTFGAKSVPQVGQGLRENLGISIRAQASGGTASIQLAYCYWDGTNETIGSWSSILSFTAGSTLLESAYFAAPEQVVSTNGADSIRVLIVTTPSTAGNQAAVWVRSW